MDENPAPPAAESASPPPAPPPVPDASAEPRHRHGPGVALLLGAAAVVTAIVAGRASFMSADASTNWQQSVREQVKQSAAYVEDIRFTYTVEEPQALSLAEARFRAQQLASEVQVTSGLTQSLLAVEQGVQNDVVKALANSSPLASDPRYQTATGYDINKRLADVRNENPDLVKLDPTKAQKRGDDFSRRSIALAESTVLAAGAFLFGSLAQGFARRRGLFLTLGTVLLAAGVVAAFVADAVA
jgi:hypothetical protein